MIIEKFKDSLIQESVKQKTVYRLVRVPVGEPLVVETDNPGKYYFQSKKVADPSLMKTKKGNLWILEVMTNSDNISSEEDGVIILKDPKKAEIQSIMPFA